LLVPLDDHVALAAAITRLSQSASTRDRLAAEAQRRISRCSVSRMVRRFETLYVSLVSEACAVSSGRGEHV
jgi:hypothetical protein